MIDTSFNQCLFLFSTPLLNLFLPFECIVYSLKFFIINQFNRQVFSCEISTFSLLMFANSFFQALFSASGVVFAICTEKDVDVGLHGGKVDIFSKKVFDWPLRLKGDFALRLHPLGTIFLHCVPKNHSGTVAFREFLGVDFAYGEYSAGIALKASGPRVILPWQNCIEGS